jgi:hypothetical protein
MAAATKKVKKKVRGYNEHGKVVVEEVEAEAQLVLAQTGLQEVEEGFILVTAINEDGTVDGFTFFQSDGDVRVVRGYTPDAPPPPEADVETARGSRKEPDRKESR